MVSAVSGSRDVNRYLARLGFAPLTVRRIAATSVLRRSLGVVGTANRLASLRRVRGGRAARRQGPPARAGMAVGPFGRGA